jgi:hypothetical protein
LWGCYGLIGGLLAAVGIALCSSKKGSSKNEVVVVPTPTTQVVKEDRG